MMRHFTMHTMEISRPMRYGNRLQNMVMILFSFLIRYSTTNIMSKPIGVLPTNTCNPLQRCIKPGVRTNIWDAPGKLRGEPKNPGTIFRMFGQKALLLVRWQAPITVEVMGKLGFGPKKTPMRYCSRRSENGIHLAQAGRKWHCVYEQEII